ncbi:hypothetical protein [Echinicola sp. 20G]|uniref:hypothetical protein n=1 Tax=Echinicola sp. 20G TaxID=2781961 RepID=UPI0019111907|nr:hypothetical protein [Echinicola sp. 20G]
MKPFVLAFKEEPLEECDPCDYLVYDESQNLTIDSMTGLPAIDSYRMETVTGTKYFGEASDSDKNMMSIRMETITNTLDYNEGTDSDRDRFSMQRLMETSTFTRTELESTDRD